jgi:hypothetical protein
VPQRLKPDTAIKNTPEQEAVDVIFPLARAGGFLVLSEFYTETVNEIAESLPFEKPDAANSSIENSNALENLYDFYKTHAEVVAPCHWAGGAVISLREANLLHPGPWSDESAPVIMADFMTFVANQIQEANKTEKDQEEAEAEPEKDQQEEVAAQATESGEVKQEAASEIKEKPDKQDKPEAKTADKSEDVIAPQQETKIVEPAKNVEAASVSPENALAADKGSAKDAKAPAPTPAAAQKGSVKQSRELPKADTIQKPKEPAKKEAINQPIKKIELQPKPEGIGIGNTEKIVSRPIAETERNSAPARQTKRTEIIEKVEADKMPELQDVSQVGPRETIDFKPELEATTDELMADVVFEGHPETDQIRFDFLENEIIVIDHSEADIFDYDTENYMFAEVEPVFENFSFVEEGSEANLQLNFEEIETEQVEPPKIDLAEISVPTEGVEEVLAEMAETIKAAEPEDLLVMNEIMAKIIEVPQKVAAETEEAITEDDAAIELEELFKELFDYIGIECTPELVESLSRLTLKYNLIAEIENLKVDDDEEQKPHSATHEFINKILVAISTIKKALKQAYVIGKSALRLYRTNFVPA